MYCWYILKFNSKQLSIHQLFIKWPTSGVIEKNRVSMPQPIQPKNRPHKNGKLIVSRFVSSCSILHCVI
uniref:Uncharacterized protein n=1 Tax=Aegilops tauschii subsp. strangulata TaxID=200361 RepID=A0A452ZGZ8_AEGTS